MKYLTTDNGWYPTLIPVASIQITENDPGWAAAFANWCAGQAPNDRPEWGGGVRFGCTEWDGYEL